MTDEVEKHAARHAAINELLDNVDANRAALIDRGYTPTASEQMAVAFHHHTLSYALSVQP